MKHPITIWPLLFLLLLLGIGGLYGGIAMLFDPTGGLLQLTEVLLLLPVPDYTLPGIFLFIVMGLAPLLLIYGLLVRPNWSFGYYISCFTKHHWAWTGTLGLCVILAIWLIIQGILIGFRWPIQYITAIDGLLIVLLAFLPGVRKHY